MVYLKYVAGLTKFPLEENNVELLSYIMYKETPDGLESGI